MPPGEPESPRQQKIEQVEHLAEVVAGLPQQVQQKLTREHLSRLLDLAEARSQRADAGERRALYLRYGFATLSLGFVFALCWLFLAYDKPDYVERVITAAIGFLGGLGIARLGKAGKGAE